MKAGRRAFLRFHDFAALVPTMVGLQAIASVEHLVARYFRDPHVRQAFGFHPLFIGGDPARVPAVYAALAYLPVVGGAWYVDGGIWSVVRALCDLVQRGGLLLTGTQATHIEQVAALAGPGRPPGGWRPALGRHRSEQCGRRRDASHGWSAGAAAAAFHELLSPLSRPQPIVFAAHHHTLLVGPDYRDFIDRTTRRRALGDTVSLYVHAPSRTEPAMATPGGESLSVLLPVPNLAGAAPWPETGDVLRERVLDVLESADGLGLHGLRSAIVVEERWTPLDFRDRLGAELGHAFGPEPLLVQSAYFRQHNRYRAPRGLYHVGSVTHPGAGIPGVLLTAEITAGLVQADQRAGRV